MLAWFNSVGASCLLTDMEKLADLMTKFGEPSVSRKRFPFCHGRKLPDLSLIENDGGATLSWQGAGNDDRSRCGLLILGNVPDSKCFENLPDITGISSTRSLCGCDSRIVVSFDSADYVDQ